MILRFQLSTSSGLVKTNNTSFCGHITFNQFELTSPKILSSFLKLGERGGRLRVGEGRERELEAGVEEKRKDPWEEEEEEEDPGLGFLEGTGGVLPIDTPWGLAGGADFRPTRGVVGEGLVINDWFARVVWGEGVARDGTGEVAERDVLGRNVWDTELFLEGDGKRGGRPLALAVS